MTTVIIAPHPDDELIGCFSTLMTGDEVIVYYMYDVTPERQAEATQLSERLRFSPVFSWPVHHVIGALLSARPTTVLVPSRKDAHAHHKQVNADFREFATHFYSVDMVDAQPLPVAQQNEKRRLLDKYYPSQQVLWERDHKYFLFESIRTRDYDIYVDVHGVTCLQEYAREVHDFLCANFYGSHEQTFNRLLKICKTGQVSLTLGKTTYKT